LILAGDIDPWHKLSYNQGEESPRTDKDVSGVLIHGTAHCANMYPASEHDVAGLTAARATVSSAITRFLAADKTPAAHRDSGGPKAHLIIAIAVSVACFAVCAGIYAMRRRQNKRESALDQHLNVGISNGLEASRTSW
jgi:hypothetical protein